MMHIARKLSTDQLVAEVDEINSILDFLSKEYTLDELQDYLIRYDREDASDLALHYENELRFFADELNHRTGSKT